MISLNKFSVSSYLLFGLPPEALVSEICSETLDQSTVITISKCEISKEINRKAYEA